MSVLRFGDFELDPAVAELRRRGRRVHLQEMPLRLLEMLLELPGELVPREAFFARLWPDDDSGILDDNLNTAVRKLRLALNDSAHRPRYIETVPKRGYRFVAPVVREADDIVPAATHGSAAVVGHGASTAAIARHGSTPAIVGHGSSAAIAGHQAAAAAVDVGPAAPMPRPFGRHRRIPVALVSLAFVAIIAAAVVFALSRSMERGPDGPMAAETVTTLAVLPFLNASGNPDDEYFSDGLTEEIMDRLSRPAAFRLVSRTSVFALKGAGLDAREIGRLLGADTLVEGSVRREDNLLRVSVRLVNARDGYQLWSETYDRRMDDNFAVQQDIALSIANTLRGRLPGPAEAAELEVPTTDPEAYDLYLQGRYYWHRRTEQGLRAAATYFEDAVRHAPDYAPAWVGLGDAYAVLGFYDYLAPDDAFPKAQEAAQRALELEPGNAAAEATLGYAALYYDWNLAEAETRFQRALALRPGYSKAHQWYANLLTAAGRFDEAEREMRRARQSDPLSLIANAALGWVRYHAGHQKDALDQYQLTLALDEDFELAYLWSGWSLEALGEYDAALGMLREAVARSGGSAISTASLARLHALRGERDEAERLLAEILTSDDYVPAYEIAKAYLALGQTEQAQEWLDRAFEQRSHSLVFLRVDPQLKALQNDAAFLRLVGQLGRN